MMLCMFDTHDSAPHKLPAHIHPQNQPSCGHMRVAAPCLLNLKAHTPLNKAARAKLAIWYACERPAEVWDGLLQQRDAAYRTRACADGVLRLL